MLQDRAMCTIIAKNYIAFARTLCNSFLSFHPDYKCYLLIVDDVEGYVNASDERFEVVTLADLDISNTPSFCFKYNVTELCTAAKPFFMEYLMDKKSIKKLLYIDPDILITNSLEKLYEHLENHDIVLTPHLDRDYPDDGLLPDDAWILRSGAFNLGFIGINSSENAKSFLEWWKPKLYKKCIVDIANGYFVDQKFIDLVPTLFDNIHIEKDVGYNVAYWNLHSRKVSRENGIWHCNGGPLYFFHFSSYHLDDPNTITGHIPNYLARYHLSEKPDVQQLFFEYKDLIVENGYLESKNWPYSYAFFKTGQLIPNELRVSYRNSPDALETHDDPFASPELIEQALTIELQSQQTVSDEEVVSNGNKFPYKITILAYRYTPGLRYVYKRWIKPNIQ